MDFEILAEGLQFPEGPIAMADGSVILVEIAAGRLTRVAPNGAKTTLAELGGGPNGAALGPDGALYVCNNGGRFTFVQQDGLMHTGAVPPEHKGGSIQRVDLSTGRFETLYDNVEGHPLWSPNDLVFDRTGGFWFTDHSRNDGRTINLGGLFYARADGSQIRKVRGGLITANGVGLSPAEDEVYVADTALGRLWAMALDGPGLLAKQPPGQPGRVVANLPGYQLLDSLAVEEGGKVCVGTLINGGITTFDPGSGATEHVAFPDRLITNICFGGADMQDAFITASTTGKLLRARWPRPGLKLNFAA